MKYYEPLIYQVPPEEDGLLLRTILTNRLGLSRKLMTKVKKTEQGVLVNGARVWMHEHVHANDTIEVYMEQEQSEDILPQPLRIDILYEDESILVVDKPAGMIVHPTHGHYINTLANGVVFHWQQSGKMYRFRPVHRLDQETSGTLAIAKNPYVHQQISQQLIEHRVQKRYHAFVWGIMTEDRGTIDQPIGRSEADSHLREVTQNGYPAVTHYQVIQRFAQATLVEFELETGRTHQIRVHSTSIGHPLIGDKLYTSPQYTAQENFIRPTIQRQALHAYQLAFEHPITKQLIQFHASLPEDMITLRHMLTHFSADTTR